MNLVRNFMSLAGAETASKVVTFAAFAWLARVAGPEGFGFLEYAGAALFCASLLVEQGFGPYGAREIARTPGITREIVAEVVQARFILAIVAWGALILFAYSLDHPPIVRQLIVIYGASLLALPLLLQWVFQGHDQMGVVAVAQLVRQTVFALIVFIFVRRPDRIRYAAIAEIAGVAVTAGYCLTVYLRRFGIAARFQRISWKLLREGVPIGMTQMFWVVRYFGSTIIVGLIAASVEVGYYAGALRILIAVHAFVWLYYFNLLPSLSRAWQNDHDRFRELTSRSLRITSWLGLIGGVIWYLLAAPAMVIVYGRSYESAGSVLQWFAPVCVVALISGHYRFGLIAAGRQNIGMAVSAIGAAVALTAIPLGYFNYGLTGAAAGMLLAETVVWIGAWTLARRLLEMTGHTSLLRRPALALLIVVSLLICIPAQSLWITLPASILSVLALFLLSEGELRRSARELISIRTHFPRNWRRT